MPQEPYEYNQPTHMNGDDQTVSPTPPAYAHFPVNKTQVSGMSCKEKLWCD